MLKLILEDIFSRTDDSKILSIGHITMIPDIQYVYIYILYIYTHVSYFPTNKQTDAHELAMSSLLVIFTISKKSNEVEGQFKVKCLESQFYGFKVS